MRPWFALASVVTCAVACDDGQKSSPDDEVEAPSPTVERAPKAQAAPTEKPVEPAPEGTVWLEPGKQLVQTCDEGCPSALQPDAAKACAALELAEQTWRLPTLAEAKRFAGTDGLHDLTTFHWTSEPFADDDKQVWIVDPKSGQSTTIPRDRKPFEVRCVADVAS